MSPRNSMELASETLRTRALHLLPVQVCYGLQSTDWRGDGCSCTISQALETNQLSLLLRSTADVLSAVALAAGISRVPFGSAQAKSRPRSART